LKTRLRYLLENSPEYALWEAASGDTVCGQQADRAGPPRTDLQPEWFRSVPTPAGAAEPAIVAAVFTELRAPLLLDDLVYAVSHLSGLGDESPELWADAEQRLAAPPPDYSQRLDDARLLERVWAEIQELPVAQRVALLLHLRDDRGSSLLPALPAAGVASLRQIAAVLEIEPGDLASMWAKLPLSDLDIAARLELRRQQVINLRKSARERLARRFSGNIRPISTSKKTEG
jgi:hypothetical protein